MCLIDVESVGKSRDRWSGEQEICHVRVTPDVSKLPAGEAKVHLADALLPPWST